MVGAGRRITRARGQRGRRRRGGGAAEPAKGGPAGDAHPDQEQAAREIADALGAALGAEVQVKPRRNGGYRAEMAFATPEEALELARRLRPRAVV